MEYETASSGSSGLPGAAPRTESGDPYEPPPKRCQGRPPDGVTALNESLVSFNFDGPSKLMGSIELVERAAVGNPLIYHYTFMKL